MNRLPSLTALASFLLLGCAVFLAVPACAQTLAPGAQSTGRDFSCPANTPNAGRFIPSGSHIPDSASGDDTKIIAYFCGSSQSSSADSAAADALAGPLYQIGEDLGEKLAGWLFGGPKPNSTPSANDEAVAAAERASEAAAERARDAEIERQRQLEAQRQAKFRADMRQLELVMGGPKLPDETTLFHDNSTCFFNMGCNSDRVLQFQQIDLSRAQQTFSNPLDELRISACLTKMAGQAKSPDEAKYLTDEAAKAMHGEALDVDVSGCAPAAGATQTTLTPAQTNLFRMLLDSTNKEMDELSKLQDQKVQLETKKAQLKQEIQTKQQLVDQLSQQTPPVAAMQADTQTTQAPQQPSSALADAEAALQAAKQQLADANQNEAQVDSEMKQVGEKLKQYQSCFQQAQADPSRASDLTKACGH